MDTLKYTAKPERSTVPVRFYDTVSEAVNDLARRGYTANLQLCAERKNLVYNGQLLELNPDTFSIRETYRFEGNTDPADETIVFAISSRDGKIKGTLVNAFGVYASSGVSALVSHLQSYLYSKSNGS